jgi:hypothetical protein
MNRHTFAHAAEGLFAAVVVAVSVVTAVTLIYTWFLN